MKRWRVVLLIILGVLLALPAAVSAQSVTADNGGTIFRVNGNATVAANQTVDSVVVINGNATIDGRVTSSVSVVNGNATIQGRVDGDVTITNGTITLGAKAVVKNVTLVHGTLNRAAGAQVTGSINQRSEFISFGWGNAIFSTAIWVGFTLLVLVAGLVFVALASRPIGEAGTLMTGQVLNTILAMVLGWVALPLIAIAAFITVLGIPLALAILLLGMPLLWLTGYIVAGTRLGEAILSVFTHGEQPSGGRALLAAMIGLLIFQVIGLVPFIGGTVMALAGFYGSGGLIYLTWNWFQRRRGRKVAVPAGPAPAV